MNLKQKVPLSRKHLLLLVYVTCVFSGWTQSACSQDKKAQVKKAQANKIADKKAQNKKVADKKAQDKKALQKKAAPGKKTGQGKSQAKPKSPPKIVEKNRGRDSRPGGAREQQLVDAVHAYVDAYNRRDANAVSQLWAANGEYTNADGQTVVGRVAIRKAIDGQFSSMSKGDLLSVTINRISFVTDDVAVEEGIAELAGESSRYRAVHKQENGQWRLHSIRDSAVSEPEPEKGKLAELEWMVGEWVDQSEQAIVRTSCRWSRNHHFLVSSFRVEMPESRVVEGTQVIGFDASRSRICSWTFDSEGTISQATWQRKGNQWTIHARYTLHDGKKGSATNVYTLKNENQYSWQSRNRRIGTEPQPDLGPVDVVKLKESSNP